MFSDSPLSVKIREISSGVLSDATIQDLTREDAKNLIDGQWWDLEGVSGETRKKELDRHWSWRNIVGKQNGNIWQHTVSITTQDGRVQGAMSYDGRTFSILSPDSTLVYVERIATAPRNRRGLVEKPLYRTVGTNLILFAILESNSLGYGGRVGLRSLPGTAPLKFYEKMGFTRIECHDDGMIDFELTPDSASQFLRVNGYEQKS